MLKKIIALDALHKKSPYSKLFWPAFFQPFPRIRSEYGEILRISPYSVRMWESAGKMRTRTAPNTDSFCTVMDGDTNPHFIGISVSDFSKDIQEICLPK